MRGSRVVVAVGLVGLIGAAVTFAARGFGGSETEPPARSDLPPATAQVMRATLTQTEHVSGTLGYGATTTIVARSSAGGAVESGNGEQSDAPPTTNTLTWLPPIGRVIRPGKPVYRIDDQPVILIKGDMPLYRKLSKGVEGADVRMFEVNLQRFGFGGFTVDDCFTSKTAAAVKRWQRVHGMDDTGSVDVNHVVVAPGRIRVAEHLATVGGEATGEVLAYTRTARKITIPLEVTRQHLVRKGLEATVTLPDGQTVTGEVAGIGTVASVAAQTADGGQQGVATVDVLVTIGNQEALGRLDAAPVSLSLVVDQREEVLTVPVGALVALAEGGYGVQVVEGSTTRYVPVTTGMFADGQVEVSGDQVVEGMTVGVPA